MVMHIFCGTNMTATSANNLQVAIQNIIEMLVCLMKWQAKRGMVESAEGEKESQPGF